MTESETIKERVITRLRDETVDDDVLSDFITTVSDRLCLRLGEDKLPSIFDSICVDAVVKMHRRTYYEGISSEDTEGMSTKFIDDILDEYSKEINAWIAKNQGQRVVKFL